MNAVIIPAAGNSTRMGKGKNKQFLKINNKEVIARTIETFEKNSKIKEIILVVKEDDFSLFNQLINNYKFKKVILAAGGKTRMTSVYNGLLKLSKDIEKVLVHDGARPFLKEKYISEILDILDIESGAVLAVKSKDTIKVIEDGYIKKTLNRDSLINVQTPQGFRKKTILKAYKNGMTNNLSATDDSSLVEKIGVKVKVVYGEYTNIKITTPEDIKTGEIILKEGS